MNYIWLVSDIQDEWSPSAYSSKRKAYLGATRQYGRLKRTGYTQGDRFFYENKDGFVIQVRRLKIDEIILCE